MSETFRSCPDCGGERLFERRHEAPGSCPDAPDGDCPELLCAGCGAALLSGFILSHADPAAVSRSAGRVA